MRQANVFLKAVKKQIEMNDDNAIFTEQVLFIKLVFPSLSSLLGFAIKFSQELFAIAKKIQLKVENFAEFLELLNNQGYILKKGPKTYQVSIV